MDMNVEKTKVMRLSKHPSTVQIDKSKPTGECEIFQLFD
jgi:hypothetical protein